jgi:hypothetical protein
VVTLSVAIFAPFFLLVRGSMFIYDHYATNSWIALAGGVGLTALLILVYAAIVARWLTGKVRLSTRMAQIALAITAAYATYGLVYLSAGNAKTPDVRSHYRSLHPLLRVAVSTLILADEELLLTDTKRQLDDYRRMGLPPNKASLHFPQSSTGYVHAIDLRTNGRSWWRNSATRGYFALMGFETMRHGGTGDHLHVSLRR